MASQPLGYESCLDTPRGTCTPRKISKQNGRHRNQWRYWGARMVGICLCWHVFQQITVLSSHAQVVWRVFVGNVETIQLRSEQTCKRRTMAPGHSKKHRLFNDGSVLYIPVIVYCLDIYQFFDIQWNWMNIFIYICSKFWNLWLSLLSSLLHSKTLMVPSSLSCHVLCSPLRRSALLMEGSINLPVYLDTVLGTQLGTGYLCFFYLVLYRELVHFVYDLYVRKDRS